MIPHASPSKPLKPVKDSPFSSVEPDSFSMPLRTSSAIDDSWTSLSVAKPEDRQYCEVKILGISGWIVREGEWDWDAEDWYGRGGFLFGSLPIKELPLLVFWRSRKELVDDECF